MKALFEDTATEIKESASESFASESAPAAEAAGSQGEDLAKIRHEAGRIAQQLNDCLTSIQGYVSLARTNLEQGIVCKEHLEQITDAVSDGAELARDLMRIEKPAPSPEPEKPTDAPAEPAQDVFETAPVLEQATFDEVAALAPPATEEAEPESVDESPAAIDKTAPQQRERRSGNETILVVEDEEMVRDLVVRSLGYLGYNVIDACNGEEGLEVGRDRREEIDMVFTDIVMPRMSGPEMVAKMTEDELGFPVLYTTGFTDNKRLLDNGEIRDGVNLLPKPYTTKVLASRIREVLDGISA